MTQNTSNNAANITTHLMEKIIANDFMHKTAIIYETPDFAKTMTYEELFQAIKLFATSLRNYGLQKGDRIFIRITNSPEVIVAFLGAMQAGIIPAMMSTHVGNGDISEYVKETQSKILFSVMKDSPNLPEFCKHFSLTDDLGTLNFGGFMDTEAADDRAITSGDDPAFITYTSGITNRPKAILHSHRFLKGIINLKATLEKFTPDSKMAYIGDLGWSFGLYQGILLPMLLGSTMYMYYDNRGFKPEKWWKSIVDNKVNIIFGTPTVFRMMGLVAPENKGELRKCMAVGETLSAETWKLWRDNFGINIIQSYGQAETGIVALDYSQEDRIPGKSGRLLPGIKYMIVDDEGKQVEDGVPGHLVVDKNYSSVMLKYISPADKNDEVFRGDWYITYDIVMQHNGILTYLGRKENILKYKGSKLSVVEIESVYRQHPDVQEAAVIEVPDVELGQILKVFVKLKVDSVESDDTAKDIQRFIASKLANIDVPKRIEFIAEMPKTKSGKTRREALRQLEMEKFLKNQAV